uniref:NADH-ubiquinone oxidoreductase chain 1 n=1 Tax=Franklinothrips vespiformis TaxID=297892 RepID=A0A8A5LA66_FRAVS|nr:NADH dehydrogenase subunit 1 [Franklinothrips vespiformis]
MLLDQIFTSILWNELIQMMLNLMCFIIMIIFSLVGVAFITLLERKVLGFIQIRLGPEKVGTLGILQPLSDAIKLYSKEINNPSLSNFLIYLMCPMMSLIYSLICWLTLPYQESLISFPLSFLFFMSILGTGTYMIMFSGWASNSQFSLLGSMRSVAQTISYEVTLLFIIISLMMLNQSLNIFQFIFLQKYTWFCLLLPLFFMWLSICLAELNRTPFDFSEGESELVSGFNTEYSGGPFALIFMAEYSMIIFLSIITSIMFLGSNFFSILFFFMSLIMMFFFIWIRATLPRFRYDKLMDMTWKVFLPSSLNLTGFILAVSLIL